MRTAKEIALIGVYTALLIGGQFILSGISGIELVTVLLASFAYCFGIRRGLLVANAFSLLRCFVFGFFPTVIIVYLIYYNLFVLVFGLLGIKLKGEFNLKNHIALILTAAIMTVLFTALDDIVTPLFYKLSFAETQAYALASLAAVAPQVLCAIITCILLFPVLYRLFTQLGYLKKLKKIQ